MFFFGCIVIYLKSRFQKRYHGRNKINIFDSEERNQEIAMLVQGGLLQPVTYWDTLRRFKLVRKYQRGTRVVLIGTFELSKHSGLQKGMFMVHSSPHLTSPHLSHYTTLTIRFAKRYHLWW